MKPALVDINELVEKHLAALSDAEIRNMVRRQLVEYYQRLNTQQITAENKYTF